MPTYGLGEMVMPTTTVRAATAPKSPASPGNAATAFSQAFSGAIASPGATQRAAAPTSGAPKPAYANTVAMPTGMPTAFQPPPPPTPTAPPGNNLTNPGYTEQAFDHVQNRLLEDPSQGLLQNQYQQTQAPSTGENFLNQNLGTLSGPGQGDQYWNQVQGQFMNPMGGEQFARQATQNFQQQGPASQFYDQAQQQYGQFTGYTGPQNSQGQYGQSSGQLANGTQGEQGMGQIAGGYNQFGQYTDPNLAAGQYAQTQQAFGDLPIANFDPFYDRARQLGVQSYNQNAAGRGVYGSSEALSGVGNVITDIEAQRANRSFDAEMARAQEQRARQALLGEQARMGDLSSQAAFGANLAGAETFAGINRDMGGLELSRNQLLGNMANAADSQALGAQQSNISGLNAFGNISANADSAETNRYQATTSAMNAADRTGLDRMNSGVANAFRGDDSARADFTAQANAASQAAGIGLDRTRLGADIANTASGNDLQRLSTFMQGANIAEGDRQARLNSQMDDVAGLSQAISNLTGQGMQNFFEMDQAAFDDMIETQLIPSMQAAGASRDEINAARENFRTAYSIYQDQRDSGGGDEEPEARPIDSDNPYGGRRPGS